MSGINLTKLTEYTRTLKITFPHPTKSNVTIDKSLRVKFKYFDDEEYKDLNSRVKNEYTDLLEDKYTQRERCAKFVTWVNPEDIEGLENTDEVLEASISNIAIQNAMLIDFAECTSGFARKNLKK